MKLQVFSFVSLISILAFSIFLFGIYPWFNPPEKVSRPFMEQDIKPNVKIEITSCYSCHGADGRANIGGAPHLAGQDQKYLIKQLKEFRSTKRVHGSMNAISKRLTDEQIEEIARHYSSLPSKTNNEK